MVYREMRPKPPLDRFVRALWYTRVPEPACGRQRVLPNGSLEIVMNLAADHLTDCGEDGRVVGRSASSLVVGFRTTAEVIDTLDLAELAGVVFEPGGAARLLGCAADVFTNAQISLEDVWGAQANRLRERLCAAPTIAAKLGVMERFLLGRMSDEREPDARVQYAVSHMVRCGGSTRIAQLTSRLGISERRFAQVFREQVGVSPKVFCRVQRFGHALAMMHAGSAPRWAELAAECGYYDQAHFANDFRSFSGIAPSDYGKGRTLWQGHVQV